MRLLSASYGAGSHTVDCTDKLQRQLHGCEQLLVLANNGQFGDPAQNEEKQLIIRAEHDGLPITAAIAEHSWALLPRSGLTDLGIFYTNNCTPPWLQRRVLAQLRKAAKGKADILVCPWELLPDCPFPQIASPYRVASHLTIALQILTLLSIGHKVGSYRRVWFLEHDVLYPEGYFDEPPLTEEAGAVANWNYRGLNAGGWQRKIQDDEPLHQMVMDASWARGHFSSVVMHCLDQSRMMLEPSMKRRRDTRIPAIHVNHGNHFTSHFNVYSKETEPLIPYWGRASDWWG